MRKARWFWPATGAAGLYYLIRQPGGPRGAWDRGRRAARRAGLWARLPAVAGAENQPAQATAGSKGGARMAARQEPSPAPRSSERPVVPVIPWNLAGDGMPAGSGGTNKDGSQRRHASSLACWKDWLVELFRRFGRDECGVMAAALAFFAILSIMPVLLVMLAVLGFFIHDPHVAVQHLQGMVTHFLPGAGSARVVQDVMAKTHMDQTVASLMRKRGLATLVGAVSLVWASMQIFVNAAAPMNSAWEVKETRGWVRLRLVGVGLFLAAGGLFLLSLLPSAGPNFVRTLHIPWLNLPQRTPFWVDAIFEVLAMALDVAMFVAIYRFLPNARVTWKQAAVGGACAGLLWEVAKKGFAVYLAHFGNYDKLYGTFGGLVMLITWIYYSGTILLLGAEITKMVAEHEEGKARNRAGVHAPATGRAGGTPAQRRPA